MPLLLRFRNFACVSLLLVPACVIRLSERNEAEENGGVTGPAADCSKVTVLPKGAPGGDAAPKFVGRFVYPPQSPTTPVFDWSGNSITVRFRGTRKLTVKLLLNGEIPQDQMFTFVVDGQPSVRQITVKNDAQGKPTLVPEEEYDIDGLDPNTAHEVVVYKNTEAQKGSVTFKGFDLNGGTLLPPTRRARRMEFIGDSITCGYGNEGKNATCPFEVKVRDILDAQGNPVMRPDGTPAVVTVPITENQYLAFSSIAARELDADAVTVCWSGKGVYKNYKERMILDPETRQMRLEDDALTTVPQLWESRTLASDFQGFPWDFANEKPEEIPQVVFISLGTNDFARDTEPPSTDPMKLSGDNIPDGDMDDPQEREKFFETYLAFVRKIRQHRPGAHIFLAVPPMLSDQFPLDNARKNLRGVLLRIVAEQERIGDRNVYQMDLVEQGVRYGLGCDYHPNLEVHRLMAWQVAGAVRSKTCW